MYDVCIVGGGVAGLSAAITIAASDSDKDIIIIEKNKKPAKKLYATGNGRCNITNTDMNIRERYHSSDSGYDVFIKAVMGDNPYESVLSFVHSLGITTYNRDGYIYPASRQASAVAWAMLDMLKCLDVTVWCGTECTGITKRDGYFVISAGDHCIQAERVILACGGRSYASLGGSRSGYKLAWSLGENIISQRPALCGLVLDNTQNTLAGVRVAADISLIDETHTIIKREKGELQYTDYGLSGIAVFNLSSIVGDMLTKNIRPIISINFLSHTDIADIVTLFENLRAKNNTRTILGFLNGFVNDRIAASVLQQLGIDNKLSIAYIDRKRLNSIISSLTDMCYEVKDLNGYEQAQVTAGGVDIAGINPASMESLSTRGLYIAGELLDIDGCCGGYNITFAILSGVRAGEACI